jgi:carbon storage regulator
MLVLSRKPGESILIGDNVEVMIGEFKENKVKIAIKAPQEVPIRRAEAVRRKGDDGGKADRGQQPNRNGDGGGGAEDGRSKGSRRFAPTGAAKGRRRVVISPGP